MFYLKLAGAVIFLLVLWCGVVMGGALYGWWRAPLAPPGDAAAFMEAAAARMAAESPGKAALVLIEDGRVFDEAYVSLPGAHVDSDTVFSVASTSKWITAWGVMVLAERGDLDLDRPVGDYLTRWQLPDTGFDNRQVTVRRLLSHTAGLTDGLGFGDYAPEEPVPGLVTSLNAPRASSEASVAIAVGREPGEWAYSGGSYLILELLVEEVSGQDFDTFIGQAVFQPLGMTRSGYRYPGDLDNSAGSYHEDGRQATPYRYASKAATGLGSSPRDMARFAMAQLNPVADRPLGQQTIDRMREPHGFAFSQPFWGLGTILYAPTDSGDFVFGHDGANDPAIGAAVRVNPDTGDAIVVLVTGSASLAAVLGFHWVFWQTGLPDVFGVASEVAGVTPVLLAGSVVILLGALLVSWRLRRRNAH